MWLTGRGTGGKYLQGGRHEGTAKRQVVGSKDHFRQAHIADEADEDAEPEAGVHGQSAFSTDSGLKIAKLDGYFDNLAAAATSDKVVQEELVKEIATLTTANKELVGINKKVITEMQVLWQDNNTLRRKLGLPTANDLGTAGT